MNIGTGCPLLAILPIVCITVSATAQIVPAPPADQSMLETVNVIGFPGNPDVPAVPADAIVIEREQIEKFGSASLATVLEQIPGISINQNSGRGSFNSLFLRGADPNFTQVRIDGVVVNDATNSRGGAFDISSINAQIIERIEIIADASSAVYGSQALAGIINIVTRTSSFETALELDSHGGQTASLFLAKNGLALSLVHERPESDLSNNDYRSDEIGTKAAWQWHRKHRLQLIGRVQRYEAAAFPDDSGGEEFAVNRELEKRSGDVVQLASHYEYDMGPGSRFDFNASWFEQAEARNTPSVAPGLRDPFGLPAIISDTNYQRLSQELHYVRSVGDVASWRTVLGWEREKGRQSGLLELPFARLPTDFNLVRTTVSLTQALAWQPTNNLDVNLSARLDRTDRDTVFSPKASVSFRMDDGRQLLYATAGKGYKQASMYALADPLIGNMNLQDETARSVQAGHRYYGAAWKIEHNLYYYEFKNLIDFEAGPPPSLVNRDSVRVRGIESIVSYQSESPWQLEFFQSFTATKVAGSDNTLRLRPRYRTGAWLHYRFSPKLIGWIKSRYIDEQFDSSIPTGNVMLEDHHITDIGVQWSVAKDWRVNAQWKNVFAKHYSNSIGNPVTGSTVLLQFTYRGAN